MARGVSISGLFKPSAVSSGRVSIRWTRSPVPVTVSIVSSARAGRADSTRAAARKRRIGGMAGNRGLECQISSNILHGNAKRDTGPHTNTLNVLRNIPSYGDVRARREDGAVPVSYTHLRAHETDSYLVCRL